MQKAVNDLVTLGHHPTVLQYRDVLSGITAPGVKLNTLPGADSGVRYTNADQYTTSVRFPKYTDLQLAIHQAKMDVQQALTQCGIAEYRKSMMMDDDVDLENAVKTFKSCMQKYQALVMFSRVSNGSQMEIAQESIHSDKVAIQEKYSTTLIKAQEATNDAVRRPLLVDLAASREKSLDLSRIGHSSDVTSKPHLSTTVVVDMLPDIRRETNARYETRERVRERNARIAKKLVSEQPKKKQVK